MTSNVFERAAALIGVIHAHVGDDRYRRRDDIGRIERAAQTDLNHRVVDMFASKAFERHRCQRFELCWVLAAFADHLVDLMSDPFDERRKTLLVYLPTVEPKTLAITRKVRRSEHARLESRRRQHLIEHGADGALAVGAGDVNGFVFRLRVAESRQEVGDALEPGLDPEHVEAFEIINCLVEVHHSNPAEQIKGRCIVDVGGANDLKLNPSYTDM